MSSSHSVFMMLRTGTRIDPRGNLIYYLITGLKTNYKVVGGVDGVSRCLAIDALGARK
jgi:hypothetical protein